jgi:ABC-type multidrug transport system fused ATPase/permease subunit
VVFALDPLLGVTLLLVWPPVLAMGLWFSSRLRVRFRQARETNSALTSRIQETLAGIRVIKAYGAETMEQQRFEQDSLAAFGAAFKARNLYAVFGILLFFVAGSAVIAGLVRGALAANGGVEVFATGLFGFLGFTVWNYGLFNFFRQRFGQGTTAVEQLMSWWGRAQDIAIGLDRVYELLDLEPEVQDRPDAVELEGLSQGIAFHGVSFAYEPGQPVLEKVDFSAKRGSITAIVGPTGSGKSTLMSLLLRLFDPDEGQIEIDGLDLRELTLASLRSSIAIALQENILFATTVRENLRYAVPDADDARVREAARVSGADDFIEALPGGYDTMLGERGTKLSTGQRQRISIARAVLKDTPILVLDEPTAALDAETEHRVLSNLVEWGRGRAIFLITHRLSTIRRADQILYLRDGRVLECGSHDELMSRPDSAYRRFVDLEDRAHQAPAAAGGC